MKARLADALKKNKKCVELYTEVFNSNKLYQEEIALHEKMQKDYQKEIDMLKYNIKNLNLTPSYIPIKIIKRDINKIDESIAPIKYLSQRPPLAPYRERCRRSSFFN